MRNDDIMAPKRSRRSTPGEAEANSDFYSSEAESDYEKSRRKRANSVTAPSRRSLGTPKRNERSRSVTPTTSKRKDRPKAALVNLLPFVSHKPKATHLLVFGHGSMGQFGLGLNELSFIPEPRLHNFFEHERQQDPELEIEDVACGSYHSLVIVKSKGEAKLLSWGVNDHGALGRLTQGDIPTEVLETQPLPVKGLEFRPTRVAAGDSFSCCLSDEGDIRQFGSFRSSTD